jgi:hypothetical protein
MRSGQTIPSDNSASTASQLANTARQNGIFRFIRAHSGSSPTNAFNAPIDAAVWHETGSGAKNRGKSWLGLCTARRKR